MKKICFLIIVLSFGLFGCEVKDYSVLITNESSLKTVRFNYDNYNDTLAPLEYKTYNVKAYTSPPKNAVDQNGIASIKMKNWQGETFTFSDAESIELNVINKLPIDIIIKSGNHIDANGSTEMFIEKGAEASAKIYTKAPNFSTTSSYPVLFDVNIFADKINVVIR